MFQSIIVYFNILEDPNNFYFPYLSDKIKRVYGYKNSNQDDHIKA